MNLVEKLISSWIRIRRLFTNLLKFKVEDSKFSLCIRQCLRNWQQIKSDFDNEKSFYLRSDDKTQTSMQNMIQNHMKAEYNKNEFIPQRHEWPRSARI